MSAFVCVLNRRGAAVEPGELRRLAEPLALFGSELSTFCMGPVGLAVRHAKAPDAPARQGPLHDADSGIVLAVSGRFHGVEEHAGADPSQAAPERIGCANWALARWPGRGASLLAGVAGSFTLIVADPGAGWLGVVRDHLGDFKVYYHLGERWLIAASEPTAILRHAAVGGDLDEHTVARFLAFRFGASQRSFFRQIHELPPGHWLRVSESASRIERYWRFRRSGLVVRSPSDEIHAGLVDRLGRSVAAQVSGLPPERVAISLSGGLDSPALAALAPRGVRAFSWRFEEIRDDETARIAEVSRHLDLPVRWVSGDGLHPLGEGFAERFVHAGSPYVNAFAALKERLYEVARAEGCTRVLVGDGGDVPYAAREYWLRDALAHRRPWALRSLARTLRGAAHGDPFARQALLRLMPIRGVRSALGWRQMPWLTAEAHGLLPPEPWSSILPAGRSRHRYELAVGTKHSELESEERRLFAQCGIERANPFWHWPLLEWVIGLPAYWLHRDGVDKVLARRAFRGRLPESILSGPAVGSLGPFFLAGLAAHRQAVRETVWRHPRSDWGRYVARRWLEPFLDADRGPIQFGHTILWRVISYELWHRHRNG